MNTVITTRAGKDLVSSLVSGLLTIGDRFGGALDGAAAEFTRAKDLGLTPREFVDQMRKANKLSQCFFSFLPATLLTSSFLYSSRYRTQVWFILHYSRNHN